MLTEEYRCDVTGYEYIEGNVVIANEISALCKKPMTFIHCDALSGID